MKKSARKNTLSEHHNFKLDSNDLYFVPLGGSEQFGVNLNLYHYKKKWLALDCGIGFADHAFPGVDILLPDTAYLEQQRDNLEALIITHAHEDHIGAVPYLWSRLRCPVYCSPFTAEVLRHKLNEVSDCDDMDIRVIEAGESFKAGPFKVTFVHMAHSIPDTCAAVVETDAGTVVHSADWNLDPMPVAGEVTDSDLLKKFGEKGVLAYVGDSTNSEKPGRSGSESDAGEGLKKLFTECKGRIVVTMFSSNIGRLRSIIEAARDNKRHVGLFGRSLQRMANVAQTCGYLDGLPHPLSEDDILDMPANKQVLVCTGSQGEFRAALARMARGDHRSISIGKGDTVIFSARSIPGNEVEINLIKNNLSKLGVKVITTEDTEHVIHVSGHPCQDEVADMFSWVRPKIVVPVHGERAQLEAHAKLAKACQIENVIVPVNGSVIRLSVDKPGEIGRVDTGLLAVEPRRVIASDHNALVERRRMQYSGVVHITVVLDERGDLVADPEISLMGLVDFDDKKDAAFVDDLYDEVTDVLADMMREDLQSDHAVHEEIRISVRRLVHLALGMKPMTSVHVVRV